MKDGGAMVEALDLNVRGARFKMRGGQYVFRHCEEGGSCSVMTRLEERRGQMMKSFA